MVKTPPSTAGGTGSILGQGTKFVLRIHEATCTHAHTHTPPTTPIMMIKVPWRTHTQRHRNTETHTSP